MARGRGSGRKTDYEWVATGGLVTALDLASTSAGLFTGGIAIAGPGTLVRTRGRVMAQLDAAAVDERVVVAVGIGVFDNRAVAAGLASLPRPFTDRGSRVWMWVGMLIVSSGAEGAVVSDGLFNWADIDSKAMRKVKEETTVTAVAEVIDSVDATGTMDLVIGYQQLIGS